MSIAATYPLSSAQFGLWLAHQMDPSNRGLMITQRKRIDGDFDPAGLRDAIAHVAAASDALRTYFTLAQNGPLQHVRSHVEPTITVVDGPADPQELDALVDRWEAKPFDIEHDVLFDTLLVRLGSQSWLWITRISHLVADGHGTSRYSAAVAAAYAQLHSGAPVDLKAVDSYEVHATADAAYRASEQWAGDVQYWRQRHAEPAQLIFSPGRGVNQAHQRITRSISREAYRALAAACQADGVKPAGAMLAVMTAIAARHHGRTDVPIGVASHNRAAASANTIGMFSGYMPFRAKPDLASTCTEVARAIDLQLRADLKHRTIAAHEVAAPGETLFDLVFSHVQIREGQALPGANLTGLGGYGCDTRAAFLLVIDEDDEKALDVVMAYKPDATDAAEVLAFVDQFVRLVSRWTELRHLPLHEFSLLDESAERALEACSSGTATPANARDDVMASFEAQVRAVPARVAVLDGAGSHTYAQVLERSRLIETHLRAAGVCAGECVGIRMGRSFDLVCSVLAVLRAGAAYMPVDASLPADRAAYMLATSGARVLLTESARSAEIAEMPGLRTLAVDTLAVPSRTAPVVADRSVRVGTLAYVLFTSGSTGKPKGVQISRGALANCIACFRQALGASSADVMLSTTGISFDIFGLELFLPLCCGARVVLADRDRLLEEGYVAALVAETGATLLQATPSLLRNLLDTGWSPDSRLSLLAGGEAVSAAIAARLKNARSIFNVYGPTEATIWASMDAVDPHSGEAPPIGKPLWNTQLHVLDSRLRRVPVGVTGELYIGGAQLAQGYAGRPDLTADRFVPDPFSVGGRIYRTGDLARWRADGRLEYFGRADQQVKINGHRIEPAEIESVLAGHPAIASAAVVARDDLPGGTQLVGYFTTRDDWPRHVAEAAAAQGQTAHWEEVYDRSYADASNGDDTGTVWTNSFTGEPYSAQEMAEWTETTVARIAQLGARRILEVGCGSGLLLRPLAGRCDAYVGTDLSAEAIRLLRADAGMPPNVSTHHLAAHEIGQLAGDRFDLIVMNSVAQYFPSAAYFRDVMSHALALLAPGGSIFVGDVRNLDLLPAFHGEVIRRRGLDTGDALALDQRIQERCDAERELCFAPSLFHQVAHEHGLDAVRVLARRGLCATEMNDYRYDVVLRKRDAGDAPVTNVAVDSVWQNPSCVADAAQRAPFTLRHIPHGRFIEGGMHPETLHSMAGAAVDVHVGPADASGHFDALFMPAGADPDACFVPSRAAHDGAVANQPLLKSLRLALVAALRDHLSARLPDYMVPAFLLPLAQLPMNTSGKLDRHALPRPAAEEPQESGRAASTMEVAVAGAVQEVLALPTLPGPGADFFRIGGHSLAAARLAARLRDRFGAEVGLRDVMEHSTVAALAAFVQGACAATEGDIVERAYEPGAEVPLSHAQEALWFLDRFQGPSSTYNIPAVACLSSGLDIGRLGRALARLVQRHCVLRTVYEDRDGVPCGKVLPPPESLSVASAQVAAAQLQAHLARFVRRPFDLARDLMLRVASFDLEDGRQAVALVVHHIAGDAQSMAMLWSELGSLYESLAGDSHDTLPTALQYADFAAWQRLRVARGDLAAQRDWWRSHLKDAPESLDLPTDRVRAQAGEALGALQTFEIAGALRGQLERLAREWEVTPFALLLAAYSVLLSKLSQQQEVVVGVPAAARQRSRLATSVGAYMNTLPLRLDTRHATMEKLVRETYERLKGALRSAEWPFDEIVRDHELQRSGGRNPLFQTMFTFLDGDVRESFAGIAARMQPVDTGGARCDLTLRVVQRAGEGYAASFEYDTALFDAATIARWSDQLVMLLHSLAAQPEAAPCALQVLPDAQRQELLGWSRGAEPRAARDVVTLIGEQARCRPESIAVVDPHEHLTYGQLEASASALARDLVARGVRHEDVVGVRMGRCARLAVAMLAVWKAGGICLPLDLGLPEARVQQVIRASGAKRVLTEDDVTLCSPGAQPFAYTVPSASCAYVIYTSGSTGEPKGVQVSRFALASFTQALAETISIDATDRVLSVASISFDMFMSELVPFLCAGARVVFADRERLLDPGYAAQTCSSHGITCAIMTPSLAKNLLAQGWRAPQGFRMMTGGEPLPREVAAQLCEFATVWNRYGPTEATVAQSASRLQPHLQSAPSIGRPFRGSQLYVLDSRLELAPVGVAGELYIGGVQLARGYLGRPDLTAERFLPSPFAAGERLYRTGDVARWNADGELEHLGRCDRQVKLRGYRIELAELEAVLLAAGGISAAAVVAREVTPGDQRLVAYVVPAGEFAMEPLREHAHRVLPSYMVPSAFVPLDRLPVNRNGKLDLQGLPSPQWEGTTGTRALRDELERAIAESMAEILGRTSPPAGDEDFFALGGHSLTAVRLLAAVRRGHGVDVSLKAFYGEPTVAGLARHVREDAAAQRSSPFVELGGRGKPALFLVHGADGQAVNFRALAQRLRHSVQVRGVDSAYLCGIAPHPRLSITELAAFYADHVCAVMSPGSPVAVGGWSFGGAVAFEMSHELRRRGFEVAASFGIDASPVPKAAPAGGAEDFAALLRRHLLASGHAMADVDAMVRDEDPDALFGRLAATYAAHKDAAHAYRPQLRDVDFTVFAAHDGPWGEDALRQAWQPVVGGRFECRTVAGDHWSMLREPHVEALAQAIGELLRGRVPAPNARMMAA